MATSFANPERQRISNPEDATLNQGTSFRDYVKLPSQEAQLRMQSSISEKCLKLLVCSTQMIPLSYASKALKSIQELDDHSRKWHNEESKKYSNFIREMKSLHEEIKSIRTSEINYDKSSSKSNIHPTNLKDTFEHYLKESCKRQDILNEWMKKFMISTEINLKNHDSSIKRLEENVNHLAQLISTHNLTNQECAIKLEPAGEKPTLKVETFAEKGRPMLAAAHARIDVFGKKISLEVGTEQITFDINERESPDVKSLLAVDPDDVVPLKKMLLRKVPSYIAVVYKDLNKKIDTLKKSKDTETPKYNSHDADSDSVKNDGVQQEKRSPPSTPAFKKRHRGCSFCILD
ncbi:hypothetical protein Tco_0954882 [Tanacetum coccineum]|uniref:Uncharacterized protein n=1 Tax=Tanacetum coccineum TaxID=301880 RepID=A0ABQ5E5M7_9ASTR